MALQETIEDRREMIASDQIVAKSPDTISRIIGQEAVIILPIRGELKVVNDVGARIWELADGTRTIADLINVIFDEYEVIREQAEKDVSDFIQLMVDKNLFVIVE